MNFSTARLTNLTVKFILKLSGVSLNHGDTLFFIGIEGYIFILLGIFVFFGA